MIDKNSGKDSSFTTIIGPDAVFKGELSFDKGVRVDGRVEGKITTKGSLAISQAGKLEADVNAGAIVVEGEVKGNVSASDKVELRQSARLTGDIKAAKLIVTEGASFTGHCSVGPNAGSSGSSSSSSSSSSGTNRVAEATKETGKETSQRR
jgi:cytoskeletal protein CcmA (bactofilin family)